MNCNLQREVTALRDTVEELKAALYKRSLETDLTMRAQKRCPACGATRILHIPDVWDKMANQAVGNLTLTGEYEKFRLGYKMKPEGFLEAYLCAVCGLVEWFAKDADSIKVDGKRILLLNPDDGAKSSPYR